MKAEGLVDFAASLREYLTLTPVKLGLVPSSVVIAKVFAGRECKALRGSLRSLRVSSPVLVRVVTTFRFSTPSTASGPETLSERPGVADTATAEAARASRAARRELENIAHGASGTL